MSRAAYDAALQRLFSRRRFGAQPGLEVIRELLAALGNPQDRFQAVHVAGSKGKGSVAAMVQSILTGAGRPTGLFTSPHLQSFRERIRIDDTLISPSEVVTGLDRIERVESELMASGRSHPPTFFEVATALGFDHFARHGVEQAVVEVGLGGRLDSTNVLHAPVGVVVTIELEHTEVLGPTVGDIAREKAGILHPGMRAIVGDLPEDAWKAVYRRTEAVGVRVLRLGTDIRVTGRSLDQEGQNFRLEVPGRTLENLRVPLAGTFQATNAGLAVAAADQFARAAGFRLSDDAIREGLARVRWPGRLDRVGRRPDLFLDVAHTEDSARAVARSLAEIAPLLNPVANVVVFGCLQGKRVEAILGVLSNLSNTIVVVPVRSDRAIPPTELRRLATGVFSRVVVADSVARGLTLARMATAEDGFTLVLGSDYLVGEVLDVLGGSANDEPDLSDPAATAPARRPVGRPASGGA